MIRIRSLLWLIGIAAVVIDATVRLADYAESRATDAEVDVIVQDAVSRALRTVAERAYHAGYEDGEAGREFRSGGAQQPALHSPADG
jgi:hypothetical protein